MFLTFVSLYRVGLLMIIGNYLRSGCIKFCFFGAVMSDHKSESWPFIDLFSGCGGFSYGFKTRLPFVPVTAVDCERGKPSSNRGKAGCNASYQLNIGPTPFDDDLFDLPPNRLANRLYRKTAIQSCLYARRLVRIFLEFDQEIVRLMVKPTVWSNDVQTS